jgi:hypothetical protein
VIEVMTLPWCHQLQYSGKERKGELTRIVLCTLRGIFKFSWPKKELLWVKKLRATSSDAGRPQQKHEADGEVSVAQFGSPKFSNGGFRSQRQSVMRLILFRGSRVSRELSLDFSRQIGPAE